MYHHIDASDGVVLASERLKVVAWHLRKPSLLRVVLTCISVSEVPEPLLFDRHAEVFAHHFRNLPCP
jgi:hypothetical protein